MKTTMLEYHLNALNHAITFQIVGQDGKIDIFLKKERVFTAPNGWRVMVSKRPEINVDRKIIYLQGSDDQYNDDVVRVKGLGKEKEVKSLVNQIDQALGALSVAASNKGDKRPFIAIDNFMVTSTIADLFGDSYGKNTPTIFVIKR